MTVGQPVISVVGNIAAGKSTLVERLSSHLGFAEYVEHFEDNPHLADFYAEPVRWAFVSQRWFILDALRRARLADAGCPAVIEHGPRWIMDVMTGALRGTALIGSEERLMEQMIAALAPEAEAYQPTVVVSLEAPTDELLRRIRKRGRPFEAGITAEQLDAIHRCAEVFLARAPVDVIHVDTTVVDIRAPSGLEQVVRQLSGPLARRLAGFR